MERTLKEQIISDLNRKMVFIAGPRQCGKTTLAMEILGANTAHYLNWDDPGGRKKILQRQFPTSGLLVLDEIHKYKNWRNLLKGTFDMRKNNLQILVTGSAKLSHYRRGGDSLQGRYHLLRMHPLSFRELGEPKQKTLERLLKLGAFPEPYFSNSETEANRWSQEYRSLVVNEELVQLEKVSEVSLVEELALRLPDLVGSPLSINSVREDLGVSHTTTARWIGLLENLYHIFRLPPFGAPRLKALKKEAKHYHYDWNVITAPGPRFENLIALHLLKYCQWLQDSQGQTLELRFFRDREHREVDFVITKDRKPIEFIECKSKSQSADPALIYLKKKFPEVTATQVCWEPCPDTTDAWGIRHCDAKTYLWEKV